MARKNIVYEAWVDDEGVTFSTVEGIEEQMKQGLLSAKAKLLHKIEARTYEEAMAAHYKEMGWGSYKPMK